MQHGCDYKGDAMKEKDNDAIAKLQEAIEYSGNKWSEWGERAEHVGELLDEALAILRKHDEAEAGGEQNEMAGYQSCGPDGPEGHDVIATRPAPTDEKALK